MALVAIPSPAQAFRGRSTPMETRSASWFGGPYEGLGSVACGRLRWTPTNALYVATRDVPCGTLTVVGYKGKYVEAVNVDWGPAAWTGRSVDLSWGLARKLHFPGTGSVRFVALDHWCRRLPRWIAGYPLSHRCR